MEITHMLRDIARIESFYSPNNCDNAKVRSSWNHIKTALLGTTPNAGSPNLPNCKEFPQAMESKITDIQQLKAKIAYYLDGGEEHTDAGIVILPLETFNKLRQLSAGDFYD
jgi:hypothetical protein